MLFKINDIVEKSDLAKDSRLRDYRQNRLWLNRKVDEFDGNRNIFSDLAIVSPMDNL